MKIIPPDGSKNARKAKHTLRNVLSAGAVLLLLVILAFAFRSQILTGVADYLIVNDRLQPADVIVLLNSEVNTRPFRASELYKQGLAPVILIARSQSTPTVELGLVPNDTDISVSVMEKLGVPAENIIVLPFPGGVTSTMDEASAVRQYVAAHQTHSILLVTSAFHTRRARRTFEKVLVGLPVKLEMVAVPYAGFDQTNWWKNENGLITLNNEYIKWFYYLFKYR
ncbi:MAG: YdcF family protein [Anaerolineales bacterium]